MPKETSNYVNNILSKDERFNKVFDSVSKLPKYKDIVDQYQEGGWLKKYQEGGIIEDDRGQWAHPGEITKINSNKITMKGVDYPVLGVSDEGDRQIMYPEGEYTFKGENVTEYPLKAHGGWLDKY